MNRALQSLLAAAILLAASSAVRSVEPELPSSRAPRDSKPSQKLGERSFDDLDRALFAPEKPSTRVPPTPQPPTPQPPAPAPRSVPREPQSPAPLNSDVSEIARQMHQAENLIRNADCRSPTRQLQQAIVARIEALLKQAARGCGQCAGCKSGGACTASAPSPQAQSPTQPSPGSAAASASKANNPADHPDPSAKSSGSQEPAAPQRVSSLQSRVWGDLPEHQRPTMQQSPADEFLPQYEDLIEQYFRRLLEGKGAPSP